MMEIKQAQQEIESIMNDRTLAYWQRTEALAKYAENLLDYPEGTPEDSSSIGTVSSACLAWSAYVNGVNNLMKKDGKNGRMGHDSEADQLGVCILETIEKAVNELEEIRTVCIPEVLDNELKQLAEAQGFRNIVII